MYVYDVEDETTAFYCYPYKLFLTHRAKQRKTKGNIFSNLARTSSGVSHEECARLKSTLLVFVGIPMEPSHQVGIVLALEAQPRFLVPSNAKHAQTVDALLLQ